MPLILLSSLSLSVIPAPFCHLYVAFTLQMGQFVRWA